mmetsp:Transcript_1376/g.4115  ORF Transcript_1376/g.4115 Transcript_1376/m.4115 type:complete len:535 (-) Transcript_1376:2154-3758(-)
MEFRSRRSAVFGRNGVAASSQPLASSIGARIIRDGGNAADAAVAMAAALAVTEPCSTGIGGDAFALFYSAETGKVTAVLGNGASPRSQILPKLLSPSDPQTVTVPGAAAAWIDILEKFGTCTKEQVLAPAIALAEDGFPVGVMTAKQWAKSETLLKDNDASCFLVDGSRAPAAAEVFRNPDFAQTLRAVAEEGSGAFYKGEIGSAIVQAIKDRGGYMELEDLAEHRTTITEPILVSYRGLQVYEVPPPTHGIAALMALNVAKNFDLNSVAGQCHNSAPYLHTMIECMRLAYTDARAFIADPAKEEVPIAQLLSDEYGAVRSQQIGQQALNVIETVDLSCFKGPETVQFCAVDAHGNACSMINSNFVGFGTGIIPKNCGFSLHNRGLNFSLDPTHPNCMGPSKKPYHTIIPAMALRGDKLFAAFGVMGGFMQPQGHFQVLCNIVDWQMDPQSALDAPRFCVGDPYSGDNLGVYIEDGVDEQAIEELKARGHHVFGPVQGFNRTMFGRGQVIVYNPETKVAMAGSDPRADGMAVAV